MPLHVVERIAEMLNDTGKAMHGSRVLVLGTAYKKNVGDVRESPAIEVIKRIEERGAFVEYHDPHVPSMRVDDHSLYSQELTSELLGQQDCVVILTDHSAVDYEFVASHAKAVFDTRNVTASIRPNHPNVQVL
jgi:UDP-N-acetyl-D-glucosamine dehydrogenase